MAEKNEHAPDGFEQLRAMLAGDLKAPMGEKLGFDLIELERGAVPLIGPRTLAQFESNIGALSLELSGEHIARLDEVSKLVAASPARTPITWGDTVPAGTIVA